MDRQREDVARREIIQGAHEAGTLRGSTWMTALASAFALLFSGYSLWETSLKAPRLTVFVSPVVHYTRDPSGNDEVFAIPLTIANQGARDGAVLSLELEAKAAGADETKVFYSAYTVDGQFFVKPGGFNQQTRSFDRVERPKTPFAPIAVAGRSAYSGTVLFYTKGKSFPKIVHQKGNYELTVSVKARLDDSLGVLDRVWAKPIAPVVMTVRLPYYSENGLLRGATHRLTSASWSVPEATEEKPPQPQLQPQPPKGAQ